MPPVIDLTAAAGVWIAATASGTVYAVDAESWAVWRTPAPGALPARGDGCWVGVESIGSPMDGDGVAGVLVVGYPVWYEYVAIGGPHWQRSSPIIELRPATPVELEQLAPRQPTRAVPGRIRAARDDARRAPLVRRPSIKALDLERASGAWIVTTTTSGTYVIDADARRIHHTPRGGVAPEPGHRQWVRWQSLERYPPSGDAAVAVGHQFVYAYRVGEQLAGHLAAAVVTIREARTPSPRDARDCVR